MIILPLCSDVIIYSYRASKDSVFRKAAIMQDRNYVKFDKKRQLPDFLRIHCNCKKIHSYMHIKGQVQTKLQTLFGDLIVLAANFRGLRVPYWRSAIAGNFTGSLLQQSDTLT